MSESSKVTIAFVIIVSIWAYRGCHRVVSEGSRYLPSYGATSAWDGSYYEVTDRIKRDLRDPSSYEHVKTRTAKDGGDLLVFVTFRARNGYGGMASKTVVARCSKEGKFLRWESGP